MDNDQGLPKSRRHTSGDQETAIAKAFQQWIVARRNVLQLEEELSAQRDAALGSPYREMCAAQLAELRVQETCLLATALELLRAFTSEGKGDGKFPQ